MKRSTWWMVGGVIAVIGGILALFNPMAGSLTATFIAAWAFIIGGIMGIVGVFTAPGAGNKILLGLFGVLSTYLGITLIRNPLEGVLSLTIAVGILVIAGGIVRLIAAFDFKGTSAFWMMIISSIASFILGYLIFAGYPDSSAYTLGILLGVELLFGGISLISMASSAKNLESSL